MPHATPSRSTPAPSSANVSPEAIARAKSAGLLTAIIYRLTHMLVALIGAGYYFTTRKEIEEVLEEEEHVLDEPPETSPGHSEDEA